MRIAMVITCKNERALLRSNLLYHHYLGVEHFYIFLDGTTDDTKETIEDLPFIEIASSVSPRQLEHRAELQEFLSKADEHHTARQILNTSAAAEMARNDGFDWLISLDADELVTLTIDESQQGHLCGFFAQIPADVETIVFETLEVVPRRPVYENVFVQETLFKRNSSKIKRQIYDPFLNRTWTVKGFYGQTSGKSALRLTTSAKMFNVHKFVALDGSPLKSTRAGHLLHYNCYSFPNFLTKYRNFRDHPDTYAAGAPIEYVPRKVWRDMVNGPGFSEEYLRDYFEKWIMFKPEEVETLKSNRRWRIVPTQPAVIEVPAVRQAFQCIRNTKI